MSNIQHDLIDSVFIKFIERYQTEHSSFEYEHKRTQGRYTNRYYLTITYSNPSMHLEVKHHINMEYSLPFFIGKQDPTKVVIDRGLKRLTQGLHKFEVQVKQELLNAHRYNVDDLVTDTYNEFKETSVFK